MRAAIDSASLIFMLKIPKLKEIVDYYIEKLYITDAIYREVFESKLSEEIKTFDKFKLERKNPRKILQTKLGIGELSVISLALEEKLLFISEDRKALLFANSIGVNTASILSILIKAKKEGKLNKDEAKSLLFTIIENGFYMSSELFSVVLKILDQ